jgi:hypothetical protein
MSSDKENESPDGPQNVFIFQQIFPREDDPKYLPRKKEDRVEVNPQQHVSADSSDKPSTKQSDKSAWIAGGATVIVALISLIGLLLSKGEKKPCILGEHIAEVQNSLDAVTEQHQKLESMLREAMKDGIQKKERQILRDRWEIASREYDQKRLDTKNALTMLKVRFSECK